MLFDIVAKSIFEESGKKICGSEMLDELGLDSIGYLTVWLSIDEWTTANNYDSVLSSAYIYEVNYSKTTINELIKLVLERSCNGYITK